MVSHWLNEDSRSFRNGKICNKVVFLSYSKENAVSGPKESQGLIDDHINIGQVLKVFISDMCIVMDESIDLLSYLSLHLWILADIVDHGCD